MAQEAPKLPRGPKDQKKTRFRARLKISSENVIFERATHRGPIFSESAKWQFSGRGDFQHTPVQLASVYPAATMQNRPRICASPCGSFRRADLHLRQWSRTMSVPTADVEKPPSANRHLAPPYFLWGLRDVEIEIFEGD